MVLYYLLAKLVSRLTRRIWDIFCLLLLTGRPALKKKRQMAVFALVVVAIKIILRESLKHGSLLLKADVQINIWEVFCFIA